MTKTNIVKCGIQTDFSMFSMRSKRHLISNVFDAIYDFSMWYYRYNGFFGLFCDAFARVKASQKNKFHRKACFSMVIEKTFWTRWATNPLFTPQIKTNRFYRCPWISILDTTECACVLGMWVWRRFESVRVEPRCARGARESRTKTHGRAFKTQRPIYPNM